mmetsp:Transcript_20793/g.57730  ORF Transcript_20793/g.57730 Transcript_20793/m.57730 type:complete len:131 (-) Transcript_20793:1236-1628(-)
MMEQTKSRLLYNFLSLFVVLVAQEDYSQRGHRGRCVPFQDGVGSLDFLEVENSPQSADEHRRLGSAVSDAFAQILHGHYRKEIPNAPEQPAAASVRPHLGKMERRQGLVGGVKRVTVLVAQIEVPEHPEG